jgi:hypothetical protein
LRPPSPVDRAATAALAALLALAAALAAAPVTNNDIFLHLATGRLVLETGRVPHVDDYSALARGRPFVAHEWLAGVVFRLIEAAAGWDGLVLFKMLLSAAIALTLYAAARAAGAAAAVALPALAFVMLLAGARLMERPHLFTYLLTALFLLLLVRARAAGRPPSWALVPLQIAWANLHGGFVLGPLLAGLYAAALAFDGERARARRAAVLVPVLVAACLLNPYGAGLLRFPFALTGSGFMELIYEWLPPYTEPYSATLMARLYVIWVLAAGAALGTALALRVRRGRPLAGGAFPLLVFAAFFVLSLRMNRNVTDFALATLPGAAAAGTALLGEAARTRARRLLPAWVALFLLAAGGLATLGYPYGAGARRETGSGLGRNIPVGAADYLDAAGVRGNLFTDYSSGAYLVWRFHPAVRVAMDSRNDVYGETLYHEYTRALGDPGALRALLARIDAAAIVLQWTQPGMVTAAATVRRLGSWRPVYFDDAATVYLEDGGPHAGLVRRDGYAVLEPSLFRPGTLTPDAAARALAEAERAVAQSGGSWIARVMRADALLAAGRRPEALAEEARLFAADPPLQHIHLLLGLLRTAAGDDEAAALRFRRALRLNPRSSFARAALQQATRGRATSPP